MSSSYQVISNRFQNLQHENENHSYLKSTSFLWNTFIFFIDLYVVSIYQIWLSLDLNPCNMYIISGISFEFIYLVNLIFIFAVKHKQNNMRYYFFTHLKFNTIYSSFISVIKLVSLLPTHFIIILYLKQLGDSDIFSDPHFPKTINLALLTKLLRFFSIKEFLDKFEHLIKFLDFNKLTFFRIFISLFHLLQATHFFACCFSGYFSVTTYDITSDYMKYIVGLQWAVEAMIGSSFGDIYPPTDGEIFLTFISMVAGSVLYCKLFSDFCSLQQISKQFSHELKEKQKQAYLLANNQHITQKLYDKMQQFYNNFDDGKNILLHYSIIQDLPSQLKQEVLLKFQQNLVQNVQIFNLGYTDFVYKMLKKMYPQVAVKDDFVLKIGDSAQEFYILVKGTVEIVSQDKKKVIRVLEPGAYFGEVAILINQFRTCYVKAQTDCIFMCIKKDHFLKIVNQFPEIKNFLTKVGEQRMSTRNYEDVNLNNVDTNSTSIKKLNIQPLQIKNTHHSNHSLIKKTVEQDIIQINQLSKVETGKNKLIQSEFLEKQQSLNNEEINFIEESINISFENENLKRKIQKVKLIKDLKVLILSQNAMVFWAMILFLALTYNLFYSFYSIFFSQDFSGDLSFVLEILSFCINLADSIIFSKLSTFSKNNNEFILNNKKILFKYLNNDFFFDVLASVPFSNIYELVYGDQEFENSKLYIRFFRMLRLLKFRRLKQYIYILEKQYKINFKYGGFFKLAYIYFFLNHLNACIMYVICKYEYENNLSDSLGIQMDSYSIHQERPFMKKNVYANFLYWALCVSTQGAYGDIWAMSSLEKTYQNVTNIFFKVFFCFLFANLADMNTVSKNMLETYLEEVDSFKHWSKLIGLSSDTQNRILKIYKHRWYQQKGMEDQQLKESLLPDTIKDKILHHRMKFIIHLTNPLKSSMLERIEMLFLKRFEKIILTQGEYVFLKGDIAQEIYFIEEGVVEIIYNNDYNNKEEILAEISKYGYFGSHEFTDMQPSLRKVSIRAKTNISLLMLDLEKYSQLVKEYPFANVFIKNIFPQKHQEENKEKNFEEKQKQHKMKKSKNQLNLDNSETSQDDYQLINKKKNEIDYNFQLKIKVMNQEKQVNLNEQIIYNKNIKMNDQIIFYHDLINSVCQTKLFSDSRSHFQNQLAETEKYVHTQSPHQCQNSQLIELMHFNEHEQNQNFDTIEAIQNKSDRFHNLIDHKEINLNTNLNILKGENQLKQAYQQLDDQVQQKITLIQKESDNQNSFKQEKYQFPLQGKQNDEKTSSLKQNQSHRRLSLIYFDDSSDFSNYQKYENQNVKNINLEKHFQKDLIQTETNSSHNEDSIYQIQHFKKQNDQFTHKNQQNKISCNYLSISKKKKHNTSSQNENYLAFNHSSFGDSQNLNLQFSKNNLIFLNQQDQFGITPTNNQFDLKKLECKENIDQLSFEDIEYDQEEQFEKIQSYFDKNLEFQVLELGIFNQTKQYNSNLTKQDIIDIQQMLFTLDQSQNQVEINNEADFQKIDEQLQKHSEQNLEHTQIISKLNSNYINLGTFSDSYYQIEELDKNVSYSQFSFNLEEPIQLNQNFNIKEEISNQQLQTKNQSTNAKKFSQLRNTFMIILLNTFNLFSKIENLISVSQLYFIIIIPLFLAFKEITYSNPILIVVETLVIVNQLRYLIQLSKFYKITVDNISQVLSSYCKAILFIYKNLLYQFFIQQKAEIQIYRSDDDNFYQKIHSLKILQKRQQKLFLKMILEIILIIPFCMIFDKLNIEGIRTRFELIFVQLIRVIPFYRIFKILQNLKKKNIYLCRVIETLIVYILFCHVLGCLFILLGKIESDFNESWFIKVPAPQNDFPKNIRTELLISDRSLYLHAIYWAYVTTSHVGVGDVTGVNLREKIYSIFVMFISTFTHIIFFGNLTSMAKEAAFMLKIKLDQKYEKIFQTVSLLNVTSFKIQVESYINFIWNDSYGLDENQILEKLPFCVKVEIFKKRYKKCIQSTPLFKSNSWQVDMDIVHSILRFMKIKIFLTNDVVAEAGKSYQDLHIFLQGKFVAFQLNGLKAFESSVGSYFGGCSNSQPLTIYFQAKSICKVGVIDRQHVKYLQQVFPDWYEKMISKQKKVYQSYLLDLSYFQKDQMANQRYVQNRFILNNKNQILDFKYSEQLLEHYQQVSLNFFEVEVANNTKDFDNNLESIQNLNKIDTSDEDDSAIENFDQIPNNQEALSMRTKLKETKEIQQWKKRITERTRSMVCDFQNISVNKSQNNASNAEFNMSKSKFSNKPYIICLPYNFKPSQKQSDIKDMIILHFFYIYKLAFIKDSEYNYFLHPYSSASYYVQIINLIFTIYSLIFTPIYVYFGLEISTLPLVFEIIHTAYLLIELFIDLRTPYFKQGLLVTNSRKIFKHLWEKKNLKLRIVCLLPLNIIMWQVSLDYQEQSFTLKIIFLLLRGIRLLQIKNLDAILTRIQTYNKSNQKILGMMLGFLHVLIMWHYFSSLWIWYVHNISVPNFPDSNWVKVNKLQDANLISKIINGLFFVMSIATTCGYPTMKSYNDIEKIFFIIAIYFGDAIIAYDFGLIASQSLLLPQKYQEIDKKTKQFKILLSIGNNKSKNNINKLHKKIELSYLYKLYSSLFTEQQLIQLQPLIPQTLYEQLLQSHQGKYLQTIPILQELSKFVHFRNIQKHIELKVFLPNDFITNKESSNGYLYFVSKGIVKILSPKEDQVIHTLYEGDLFSQVTLTKYGKSSQCRIYTSNIAEIVQIKHKNVQLMLQIFPQFKNTIYKHARKQIPLPGLSNLVKLNLLSDYQQEALSQIYKFNEGEFYDYDKVQNNHSNLVFTEENFQDEQQMFKSYFGNLNKHKFRSAQMINKNQRSNNTIQSQFPFKQHQEGNVLQNSQQAFSSKNMSNEDLENHVKTITNIQKNFLIEDDDNNDSIFQKNCIDQNHQNQLKKQNQIRMSQKDIQRSINNLHKKLPKKHYKMDQNTNLSQIQYPSQNNQQYDQSIQQKNEGKINYQLQFGLFSNNDINNKTNQNTIDNNMKDNQQQKEENLNEISKQSASIIDLGI